ncbi:MAG TPA: 30S ribosomal protein S16 [Bacteroidia bacterium]|jgi:small subunit ribosomal protein S16|nr:30S ribosomal protein S16 [Bacteroidia bacterium]
MPVKIRLQRHGKKARAFFHIVIADGRAPRDGKFIEKIGTYNPTTNPATIDLNFEKAMTWLSNGAQPTDTCRAILSYKGVMYKNHLQIGVNKGAVTQEVADAKFSKWLADKDAKIQSKVEKLSGAQKDAYSKRLAAEAKANEAKAAKIVAKNTPPPAPEPVAEAPAAEAETPATPAENTEA